MESLNIILNDLFSVVPKELFLLSLGIFLFLGLFDNILSNMTDKTAKNEYITY